MTRRLRTHHRDFGDIVWYGVNAAEEGPRTTTEFDDNLRRLVAAMETADDDLWNGSLLLRDLCVSG